TSTRTRPTRSRRGPPAAISPGRRRSCAGSSGATVSPGRPGLRSDSPATALVEALPPLARRERRRAEVHGGRGGPAVSVSGTATVELFLAGTFRVVRDGVQLTDGEIGSRKSRTLLKLLAVERPA